MRQAFARLSLAARIGAAIVAAVAAIQVLVTLVFVLNPPNFHPFYSARWLSSAAVKIIKNSTLGEAEFANALGDLQERRISRCSFRQCAPQSRAWRTSVAAEQSASHRSERGWRRCGPCYRGRWNGTTGRAHPGLASRRLCSPPQRTSSVRRGPVIAPCISDRRGSPQWPLADD
jgi:hypothetical protein